MTDAPKRIWVDQDDIAWPHDFPTKETVEYIRADLLPSEESMALCLESTNGLPVRKRAEAIISLLKGATK